MATLKETRIRLEKASEMEKINITKGEKDQVLIDLNGDGKADAALFDTCDSGTPDVLAIDVTGDNKFNLFLDDTDNNEYPDVIYMDKKGDGNFQLLSVGEEIRGSVHDKLVKIYAVLVDEESTTEELSDALHDLAAVVRDIKAKIAKK